MGPWLRVVDLNHRPSDYEPDELPSCSNPRWIVSDNLLEDKMADDGGFEPSRAFRHLSVFKTDPFNQAWVIILI